MSNRAIVISLCALLLTPNSWSSATSPHRELAPSARFDPSPQTPGLIINEYLADPPAAGGDANGDGLVSSSNDEFIELVNPASSALDAGGYAIVTGTTTRFTFPAGKMIPPGEAAVVFGGGTPTGSFGNAKALGLVFTASLSLLNGGTTITIKDNLGVTVDTLTYGSSQGNADQSITRSPDVTGSFVTHSTAAGAGGRKFSPGTRVDGTVFTAPVPFVDSISPNTAVVGSGPAEITINGGAFENGAGVLVDGAPISTSFISASQLTATVPSAVIEVAGVHQISVQNPSLATSNSAGFVVLPAVGINEVLADPPGSAAGDIFGDANGDGVRDTADDEFIEIVNRTDAPVDIGGYSIIDAGSVSPRFVFPPGAILPAREAAVVFGGGSPQGDFGNAAANGLVFTAGGLSLNNTSETITLRDPGGNPVETVSYGAEGGQDESLNRNPEGIGAFAKHTTIAGAGSRRFSPGTPVDGAPFTVGPRIAAIAPDSARQGDPPFDLQVAGSGFESGSQVFIDGIQMDTMFVGPGELMARVPASVTGAGGPHSVRVRNEGGNRSNSVTLTIIPPPPVLSSLLPKFVVVNGPQFTLLVTGLNFDRDSVVLIEGTAVPASLVNPRELRATVAGSFIATLGTRRVAVRSGDGRLSNEASFEVISPLTTLTSVNPNNAIAGGPGSALTIRGANFKSNAVARFDAIDLATRFDSTTQLTAQAPAPLIAAPGAHAISVVNPGEAASNELIFEVLPDPPVLVSLDPPSATEGSDDAIVRLIGSKFINGAVVRAIEENNRGAKLETTFISEERLEARIPSSLISRAGVVVLAVENPDLGLSKGAPFRVLIRHALVINEYLADPPEGLAGDANGDGSRSSASDEFVEILNRTGEAFDISGYKLSDADAIRHVFAAGTVLPPFEATVVFGGGTPTGPFGNAAENHLVFKASTGGLSLGNGGDTIKLQDAQDRIVQEIKFGAREGGAGQSINRDPDGDGPTFTLHTIVAANPNRLFSPGTHAAGETFTVKPAILGLSPASVRIGSPPFLLGVSGTRFLPGAVVMLGNTELPTTYFSESQLEAQVSASLLTAGGAADIRVRNPRGEVSSEARLLIVDDPPRVLGIDPKTAGTGAEKLEAAFDGERFQTGAEVLANGVPVETRFVSGTSLVVVLPASLFVRAAEISLQVQNADGNLSNKVTMAVENGPLITRLSRGRVRAGRGAFELTLGGVAFKPGIVLFANDIAVSTTYVSETEFRARIPAEMTNQPGTLTLQARNSNGGRSNMVKFKVMPQ